MQPQQDAFGQMLAASLRGEREAEAIERDDGFVNVGGGYAHYFATHEAWSPVEQEAIACVRGRVLDIGCGAGRHALYLQERGHAVVAVDVSPLAVQVCRERGVRDARVIPITRLSRALGPFDTILMLGNNSGLLGNVNRARWLLRRFRSLTTSQGLILAANTNPYSTTNPAHTGYHERNRQRGRMAGQVRIRVRFRQYTTAWFDLLLISPDEMRDIVSGTGWHIHQLLGDPNGGYVAVLEKEPA